MIQEEIKKLAEERYPKLIPSFDNNGMGFNAELMKVNSFLRKGFIEGFKQGEDSLQSEIRELNNIIKNNTQEFEDVSEELDDLKTSYDELGEDYQSLEEDYETLEAELTEVKEQNKKFQCIIDSQAISKLKSDSEKEVKKYLPRTSFNCGFITWHYLTEASENNSSVQTLPEPGVNVRLAFESVKNKGKIEYTIAYLDEFGIWHHYKENWTYSKPIAWCVLPKLPKA